MKKILLILLLVILLYLIYNCINCKNIDTFNIGITEEDWYVWCKNRLPCYKFNNFLDAKDFKPLLLSLRSDIKEEDCYHILKDNPIFKRNCSGLEVDGMEAMEIAKTQGKIMTYIDYVIDEAKSAHPSFRDYSTLSVKEIQEINDLLKNRCGDTEPEPEPEFTPPVRTEYIPVTRKLLQTIFRQDRSGNPPESELFTIFKPYKKTLTIKGCNTINNLCMNRDEETYETNIAKISEGVHKNLDTYSIGRLDIIKAAYGLMNHDIDSTIHYLNINEISEEKVEEIIHNSKGRPSIYDDNKLCDMLHLRWLNLEFACQTLKTNLEIEKGKTHILVEQFYSYHYDTHRVRGDERITKLLDTDPMYDYENNDDASFEDYYNPIREVLGNSISFPILKFHDNSNYKVLMQELADTQLMNLDGMNVFILLLAQSEAQSGILERLIGIIRRFGFLNDSNIVNEIELEQKIHTFLETYLIGYIIEVA